MRGKTKKKKRDTHAITTLTRRFLTVSTSQYTFKKKSGECVGEVKVDNEKGGQKAMQQHLRKRKKKKAKKSPLSM